MLIGFWFGGEILTAIWAGVMLALFFGEEFEPYVPLAYVAAIVGAALGAWLAFVIVKNLSDQSDSEPDSEGLLLEE